MVEGYIKWPHQQEREILDDVTPATYPSCKGCGADVTLGYIYVSGAGSFCQDCYNRAKATVNEPEYYDDEEEEVYYDEEEEEYV